MGLLRGRAWAAETGGWGPGGVCCTAPYNPGGCWLAAARTLPHELIDLCSGGGVGCETYRCSVPDSFICSQILEALVTHGRRDGGRGGELCFTSEKCNFLCVKNTERPHDPVITARSRAERTGQPDLVATRKHRARV